ncbi:MAG: S8 family serine peptidase [Anaerolineae bacterium]
MTRRSVLVAVLLLACVVSIVPVARALEPGDAPAGSAARSLPVGAPSAVEESDGPGDPATSHRLIVELESPPVAVWAQGRTDPGLWTNGQRLDVSAPAAVAYERLLELEHDLFVKQLKVAVPQAKVATYLDEQLVEREADYTILVNGMAVDAGLHADLDALEAALRGLPGVKDVYRDYAHEPHLYASVPLINAEATWNVPEIGGMDNAGAGIKFASVDGGILADAAMFDGEGYEFPTGFPLGYLDNVNGKVIASRAYFRTWDPPAPGDEFPWPGERGTSHGQHTSSTAVGNAVTANYNGVDVALSGVAPKAYAMSYRVFYYSTQGIGSVYSTESTAALEDVVRDGADVVNNSWGGGSFSPGGPGDVVDTALTNCWKAGVFVSMSNGNSGPNTFTGDHPSGEYINVGNSTTSGLFVNDGINVTAPEPVTDTLMHMAMAIGQYGELLEGGQTYGPFGYITAASVDPENFEGCNEWPAGTFDGKAAVISRGNCEFGKKSYYAEQAGAQFVIIHNTEENGDALVNMSGGEFGVSVTISSVFIGYTGGMGMTDWQAEHPDDAAFEASTKAYQAGYTPDIMAGSSSRGPAVGYRLDPDITAPGTNILAQGYGDGEGVDRHRGYGQASGTSMASPHVAGSAVLLRQARPEWSNDYIKSALMSTSKYLGIYNDSGQTVPAQPLDMGAGRLDLTNATDPGIILDPPMLSFGVVPNGRTGAVAVTLTSVSDETETYELSSIDTALSMTDTVEVAGLSFEPESVTLDPGSSATITVTWNTSEALYELADNQGYLLLTSDAHEAHMPAWMRIGYPKKLADVLLFDNDGSGISYEIREMLFGAGNVITFTNYADYYTDVLDNLGVTYEVYDFDESLSFPSAGYLMQYDSVLHFTGDNFIDVLFGNAEMQQLHEYLANGGSYVGFGQELAAVLQSANPADPEAGSDFYQYDLGAQFLQDSVNGQQVFTTSVQPIVGMPGTAFDGLAFDMSATGDGAGNLVYVDEIRPNLNPTELSDPVLPPLLTYPGPNAIEHGYVALSYRDQPTLELPHLGWLGRSSYFAFGLEGINNDTGFADRLELGARALGIVLDEATASISATVNAAYMVSSFSADMESTWGTYPLTLRWDFGDGTDFTDAYPMQNPADPDDPAYNVGHVYTKPGTYTVRVEAVNDLGTHAIGETEIIVGEVLPEHGYIDRWHFIYAPFTAKGYDMDTPDADTP